MSIIGVIMGEFLVSKKGIGYLILYGSQVFNLSLVMTGIVLLAIVSIIILLFCFIVFTSFTPAIGLFKDPVTNGYGIIT